jgi:hypothetical protein
VKAIERKGAFRYWIEINTCRPINGSDDFVGIGRPDKGLWLTGRLGEEAVDRSLEFNDRAKDATLEAAAGELGEVLFDRIEPGGGRRGEVEGEAGMALEPGADLRMLVSGVAVSEELMTEANSMVNDVAAPKMPVFYSRPRPVNAIVDRGRSLGLLADFGFARGTNSVVLNAVEFPHAARTYPIVFTTVEPRAAIAVLGLEGQENLFVTEAGTWQPNAYVPAYVRRYPFILMEQPEKNEYVLCIDEDANLLSTSEERPLFKDDAPTQVVQDALSFCREFQEQTAATGAFVTELVKHDLLVQNEARIALNSGKQMTLRDFNVVDETKFNALPDEVFLEWRRRGWLHLVYCHLLSMANWANLVELAAKKA